MSSYGQLLAEFFDARGVAAVLRQEVDYGTAFPTTAQLWPPRPGCTASPDLALARMWACINLADWIARAPNAFGPHHPGELDVLAAVGARLRTAGEGARVLWGIDLVPAERWVAQSSTSLAVAELICYGPRLAAGLVNEIDATLFRIGWCYNNSDLANQPCTVNHASCFENSWHEGNSRSQRDRNHLSQTRSCRD